MQYSYDSTGAFFNYFLLSFLSLILIPLTFARKSTARTEKKTFLSSDEEKKYRRLAAKKSKKTGFVTPRSVLLVAGWIFFGFVLYKAVVTKIDEQLWDPYEILGVSTSADSSQIKRAFRKLSLQFHPDKLDPNDKEGANRFIEISKAHKVLTDPEAKAIFDEFGHPDGKQSFAHGIALPTWLVAKENSPLVLLVYGLIFGLGLPLYVARWWYKSKDITKQQILNVTMARFYRETKETTTMKKLLEILCIAQEFQSIHRKGPVFDQLKAKVSAELKSRVGEGRVACSVKYPDVDWADAALVYLYAHIFRIDALEGSPDEVETVQTTKEFVAEIGVKLCTGIMQICMSYGWLNVVVVALDLEQMLVQSVFINQPPVAQLPLLNNPELLKHFKSKKRNISSVKDFLLLPLEERRALLRSLDDDAFAQVDRVASHFPLFRMEKAFFSVLGEDKITPSSLVTLTVKITRLSHEDIEAERSGTKLSTLTVRGEEELAAEIEHLNAPSKKKWWSEKEKLTSVYAPFFPAEKKGVFWVIMADPSRNRVITMQKISLEAIDEPLRLQFQAPPQPGSWEFAVLLKCDFCIGSDDIIKLKLQVVKDDAPPPPEELIIDTEDEYDEEDESEDESAGPKKKKTKGEYEDSSDDSDVDESDAHSVASDFVE